MDKAKRSRLLQLHSNISPMISPGCFIMTAEISPILSLRCFSLFAGTDRPIEFACRCFNKTVDAFPNDRPVVLQPLCWHRPYNQAPGASAFLLALTAQDRRYVDRRPVVLQPLCWHRPYLLKLHLVATGGQHQARSRALTGFVL